MLVALRTHRLFGDFYGWLFVKQTGGRSHFQILGHHLLGFQVFVAQWDGDDKLAPLAICVVMSRDGAVVQFYQRTGEVETDTSAHIAVVDA